MKHSFVLAGWYVTAVLLMVSGPAAAEIELFVTVSDRDQGGANKLGLLDAESGFVNEIGPTGAEIGDISFAPDGRLYGLDSAADQLMMLDSLTGVAMPVGSLGIDIDRTSGLTFDQSGALWLIDGSLDSSRFYSVDPANGGATLRGEVGHGDCQALAAVGLTVYSDGFQELVINTATGLGVPVGSSHSGFPTAAMSTDAVSLWSLRSCAVCWGPIDTYDLVVTDIDTWHSETLTGLDLRWQPLGLAVRQLRQQPIPMLQPLLIGLLIALLLAAGSLLLLAK